MKKITIAAALLAVATTVVIANADDARSTESYSTVDDVYSGTGWKIFTSEKVLSIDPSQTYVVTYASTSARSKLQPMLEKSITQLQALGIKIYNTTQIETIATTSCAPKNHIVMGTKYRPAGSTKGGVSIGDPCYNTTNMSMWSGKVWMDSEYKQLGGTWSLSDKAWKNGVVHEFGHALGLDHAPAVSPKPTNGDTPIMTAPNGGFNTTSKYGQLTSWDIAGFKQLKENFDV